MKFDIITIFPEIFDSYLNLILMRRPAYWQDSFLDCFKFI